MRTLALFLLLVPTALAAVSWTPPPQCGWGWQSPSCDALEWKLRGGFQRCQQGPFVTVGGCCAFAYDLDVDADVDLRDWANFTNCMAIECERPPVVMFLRGRPVRADEYVRLFPLPE